MPPSLQDQVDAQALIEQNDSANRSPNNKGHTTDDHVDVSARRCRRSTNDQLHQAACRRVATQLFPKSFPSRLTTPLAQHFKNNKTPAGAEVYVLVALGGIEPPT